MKRTCIFLLLLLAQQFVFSQQKMKALIDEQMKFAVEQYKVLAAKTPENKMPRTFQQQTNKLVLSEVEWWTSGFYPGTLWYIYEYSKDVTIRKEAEARLRLQKKVQHFTGNHDVGFMIFCSFGNAYRITGDTAYRTPIHNAAEALSTRYKPAMKAIQSWNTSKRFNAPVIIDNMMNLELLSWVTRDGGAKKYWDIAVNHANTTLANHFRPDNSCYHVVDYDLNSGMPTQKKTWQGLNDQSAWSRGQGWALYGYTMMYRFTRDKKYLEQAKKVAGFILNHPNLPADKIPYWDFDAPASDTTLRSDGFRFTGVRTVHQRKGTEKNCCRCRNHDPISGRYECVPRSIGNQWWIPAETQRRRPSLQRRSGRTTYLCRLLFCRSLAPLQKMVPVKPLRPS